MHTDLAMLGIILLTSYLIGAIPFGYLVSRWRGVDIFRHGSGNIGATNVGRVLGRPYGVLVFVLDFAKGAVPVAVANWLAEQTQSQLPADSLPVAAGLAAFLGHLFPVYLRFRGGKGVATGAGVVAVLLPGPAVGALLCWLLVICLTLYVSLASLSAAIVLCVMRLAMTPAPFSENSRLLTLFCFVAAALVFLRHYSNIQRLVNGTENRLKDSAAMFQFTKTVHVLAAGLWFGSMVFFSFVVAPILFATFGALGEQPLEERPSWLAPSFSKEQGTQLAGMAVGPIFPWYFLLQGICGLFAAATALKWSRAQPVVRVHQVRLYVLALGMACVLAAWPIGQKVAELRIARFAADPASAQSASSSFATWHLASLALNFVTLALVTVAMVLVAWLPSVTSSMETRAAEVEPAE